MIIIIEGNNYGIKKTRKLVIFFISILKFYGSLRKLLVTKKTKQIKTNSSRVTFLKKIRERFFC